MINYNGRIFKSVVHSSNGETVPGSIFTYYQCGNIVTCHYKSKNVISGHLMAIVNDQGHLDMRYHQVNAKGELRTGICKSVPEIMDNGKIRLQESWRWTSGDRSKGNSTLEEM